MKIFRVTVVASFTAFSGVAMSATDGTTGATSTGTSIVSVTKENLVRITGVDDYDFLTLNYLEAPEALASNLCVYSTGTYSITATSDTSDFVLDSGGATTIDYTVNWNAGTATDLTYNTALEAQSGNQTEELCGTGGDNVTLTVTLDNTTFNAAGAGAYTSTLTLLVAAE